MKNHIINSPEALFLKKYMSITFGQHCIIGTRVKSAINKQLLMENLVCNPVAKPVPQFCQI